MRTVALCNFKGRNIKKKLEKNQARILNDELQILNDFVIVGGIINQCEKVYITRKTNNLCSGDKWSAFTVLWALRSAVCNIICTARIVYGILNDSVTKRFQFNWIYGRWFFYAVLHSLFCSRPQRRSAFVILGFFSSLTFSLFLVVSFYSYVTLQLKECCDSGVLLLYDTSSKAAQQCRTQSVDLCLGSGATNKNQFKWNQMQTIFRVQLI